ncbi:hypothetical protein [Microbacterium sp.]|uniref:hypothetical protein n=1 Tax=Microbacterium sp. TaxID=51671 RepID=UPI003A89E965
MTLPAPPTYPFDARPLTEAVDRGAAAAFRAHLIASGRAPRTSSVASIVVGVVVGIMLLSMFVPFVIALAGSLLSAAFDGSFGGLPLFVLLVMLAVFGGMVTAVVLGIRRSVRSAAERWYRFDRFAGANGMQWYPTTPDPPLPGMIFSLGSSRASHDIVRGTEPRLVEFGNYQYTTGSGKNKTTHRWGYVAVHLSTPLPHIVLDAVGNNGLFGSNLPASFDKDQRWSLEGDFDRYFHLYCPRGYERDALYLFTPDIMARFIDNVAALDVEIIDNWMFLYARRDFATLDPAVWNWLFSVVRALLDKLAQWERWRDDRLAPVAPRPVTAGDGTGLPFQAPQALVIPPGVAPPGKRLSRRVRWVPIIIVVVGGAVWFLIQSGAMFAFLR